jgi:riboflavin kinase/FMN adenylyltransferase
VLIFRSAAEVPPDFGPSAVTIGKFDGLHFGHRAVLAQMLGIAHRRGLATIVVTFDRNPLSLLHPDRAPKRLLSNEQRLERLESVGVDATLMIEFNEELSAESPEEFVDSILVGALKARVVFVGSDFRFGTHGAGDVKLLAELGRTRRIQVIVVDDTQHEGRRISSTWIRELLMAGDVRAAAEALGTLHTVRGTVVHGQQIGRTLGYPTANLSPDLEGFIPADGVYAAWLTVDGVRYPAAVSVGNNPTFDGVPEKQIEAHALDQDIDLYGKTVEVSFVEFVRGMRKFDGVEALVAQMRLDEQRIREILGVASRA